MSPVVDSYASATAVADASTICFMLASDVSSASAFCRVSVTIDPSLSLSGAGALVPMEAAESFRAAPMAATAWVSEDAVASPWPATTATACTTASTCC